MTDDTPTIYQRLLAAGVPLDSHASDLYALVTPASEAIVRGFPSRSCSVFVSNVDGLRWYEIPFAFDPFWDAVRQRSKEREA